MAVSLPGIAGPIHGARPSAGAEGPAIRLSGFAPGESVEPGVASITPSLRQTNKKAAPWGGFFIDLAERGAASPIIHAMSAHVTSVYMCMI